MNRQCLVAFLSTWTLIAGSTISLAQGRPRISSSERMAMKSPEYALKVLQLLRESKTEEAWEVLGEYVDDAPTTFNSKNVGLPAAAGGLYRSLMQMSPDERYERLHAWTMPSEDGKQVRLFAATVSQQAPPSAFARVLRERPRETSFPIAHVGDVKGLFSTGWMLTQAAHEVGALSRLRLEAEELAERNVKYADEFVLLATLAETRIDGEELQAMLEQRITKATATPEIDMRDIVIAAAALKHEELRATAVGFFKTLTLMANGEVQLELRPFLRMSHAIAVQRQLGDSDPTVLWRNPTKYWVPSSQVVPPTSAVGDVTPIWLLHEDHILHLTGNNNDVFFCRYPLAGPFDFMLETQEGGPVGTDGGLVFGGLQFEALGRTNQLRVWNADMSRTEQKPCPFIRTEDRPVFNRHSIRFQEGQAIYLANLHPMWTDSRECLASPWLGLRSLGKNRPVFRNLEFKEEPGVVREVPLVVENELRGWMNASPRGRVGIPVLAGSRVIMLDTASEWTASEGRIEAARIEVDDAMRQSLPRQSLLTYQRPLLDGESVTYEFYHEAGTYEAHPAFGRLVFLIDAKGIQIHWVTDPHYEWTTLPPDNAQLEPFSRRGPRTLPLKEADWNTMSLSLMDGKLQLTLNEELVYERANDLEGPQGFGFYRDRFASSARIRNVVMTGDWPETLPADFLENPVVKAEPSEAAMRVLPLNATWGEPLIAENVFPIRRQAARLDLEERYEFLKNWVLPAESARPLRAGGAFTPTDPALHPDVTDDPALWASLSGGGDSFSRRDGILVSPVYDLLDVAGTLNRLKELREEVVQGGRPGHRLGQRTAICLLMLIDIQLDDTKKVNAGLQELLPLLKQTTPDSLEAIWPETLVVWRGMQAAQPHPAVKEIVNVLYSHFARNRLPKGADQWQTQLSLLNAQANFPELSDSGGATSELQDWILIERIRAVSRGDGNPHATWRLLERTGQHTSGHQEEYVLYRSPLAGDFEMAAEMSTWYAQGMAGGKFYGPTTGQRKLNVGTVRSGGHQTILNEPFSKFDSWLSFRSRFANDVCSIFINGRLVDQADYASARDPWVGFRFWWPSIGSFRHVNIVGDPLVPDEIALIGNEEMRGWLHYYDESIGYNNATWHARPGGNGGYEIIGRIWPELKGANRESLIRYHRPLIEDGEIEYEFFYEPGQYQTHPAFDRLVFLLDPEGVKLHWLTDAHFDRTRLEPGNVIVETEYRRGPERLPLVVGDWNRLKLTVQDNELSLVLNDQLIYQRPIEASNDRTFGLFHFADQSEVRVRNIVMRAEWPKSIPSVTEQQLADVSVVELEASLGELPDVFECDFGSVGIPTEYFKTHGPVAQAVMSVEASGLRETVHAANKWTSVGIVPRFSMEGDFDIEAEFDQFRARDNEKGGSVRLVAHIEDQFTQIAKTIRGDYVDGRQFVRGEVALSIPEGGQRSRSTSKNTEPVGGRLRVIRRGDEFFSLFAEGDSQVFRIIHRQPISENKMMMDGVRLVTIASGIGETSVLWKNVKIRAERLLYLEDKRGEEPVGLYVMDVEGEEVRNVAMPPMGLGDMGSPEWSADGKRIACDIAQKTSGWRIHVIDLESGEMKDLGPGAMPSFSADAGRVVFSRSGAGVVITDLEGQLIKTVDEDAWGAHWSPDGETIAYYKRSTGNVTLYDVETGETEFLLTGEHARRYSFIYWHMSWSNDSRSVCFKGRNRQTGEYEIAVADVGSPEGFQVLYRSANNPGGDCTWSPDGRQIIISHPHPSSPRRALTIFDRENEEVTEPLPHQPDDFNMLDVDWSLDGKSIIFSGQPLPKEVEWPLEKPVRDS